MRFLSTSGAALRRWLAGSPWLGTLLPAAVAVALFAVLGFRGLQHGGGLGNSRSNDFAAYHAAARGVLKGDLVPSYSAPRPYQYPPTLAVLAAPLGLLPRQAAAALWTLICLGLLIGAFRAAGTALGPPVKGVDQLLGFLLVFRMFENDFSNGNANTLVLAVLLLGFALARRGRPAASGSLLGLAAALKISPLLLLPWLIAARRWRMARGFLLGLLLWGLAFPVLVLGPVQYGRAWGEFYDVTLRPLNAAGQGYRREPPGDYLAGQSLRSLLHRLLRATDATAHDQEVVKLNLADLPKGVVDGIYLALSGAVLGLLLRRFRGRGAPFSGPEIGAALAAMALLAPLSRKAHFVALFPAAVAGFAHFRSSVGGRRRLAGALLGGAFALIALSAPGLVGRKTSTLLLGLCPFSLAAGLLLVLCALAHRPRRASAAVLPCGLPAGGTPPPSQVRGL
jgi:alpha-1,2-mannosyltransferase